MYRRRKNVGEKCNEPIHEPLSQNEMAVVDWLSIAKNSFFKLSLLISRELNIQMH
jgi:hypothetical protein